MAAAAPLAEKVRGFFAAVFIALTVLVFGAVFFQNFVLPDVIVQSLGSSLGVKISGKTKPVIGKLQFEVHALRLLWEKKVNIQSGKVKVQYGWDLFFNQTKRIRITGQNLETVFLGEWAGLAGIPSADFSSFYADLLIDDTGIREIRALRADSPAIQFRWGEAANRRLKETHEA